MYYAQENKARLDTDTLNWNITAFFWKFETKEQRDAVCDCKPSVFSILKKDIPQENPAKLATVVPCRSTVRIIEK